MAPPSDFGSSSSGGGDDDDRRYSGHSEILIIALLITVSTVGAMLLLFWMFGQRSTDEDVEDGIPSAGPASDDRGEEREELGNAAIEKLPATTSYKRFKDLGGGGGNVDSCAVCLIEFEDRELVRVLPKCQHVFHRSCIDTWLFSHTSCPLCRGELVGIHCENPEGDENGIGECLNH